MAVATKIHGLPSIQSGEQHLLMGHWKPPLSLSTAFPDLGDVSPFASSGGPKARSRGPRLRCASLGLNGYVTISQSPSTWSVMPQPESARKPQARASIPAREASNICGVEAGAKAGPAPHLSRDGSLACPPRHIGPSRSRASSSAHSRGVNNASRRIWQRSRASPPFRCPVLLGARPRFCIYLPAADISRNEGGRCEA
jgi:hypothetical protein